MIKGATIATRVASKWGGAMIKPYGLSIFLLYSVFYVNSCVCRLSSQQSVNISGIVYNREFIIQNIPISHSPSKFKF